MCHNTRSRSFHSPNSSSVSFKSSRSVCDLHTLVGMRLFTLHVRKNVAHSTLRPLVVDVRNFASAWAR